MNVGSSIFVQLMDLAPRYEFNKCVSRWVGKYQAKKFSFWDQFLCMSFAQLTHRESLRDIETCLRATSSKLYHIGIRSKVSRSTLAEANNQRDWRIFADFALIMISEARKLYAGDEFGLELENSVYALDSTVIDLCLTLFPWAQYNERSAGVRVNTLLDLRGSIPAFIHISSQKTSELVAMDLIIPEPGSIYIFDRGYFDWGRLQRFTNASAFFVTRGKKDLSFTRLYSNPVCKANGILADQIIVPNDPDSKRRYYNKVRRIKYVDHQTHNRLVFLTNNLSLPAETIAELYRSRWNIELFFKWMKQHLRIKSFFGASENAVKTQIWIAVTTYVLVAILKKKLQLHQSLYTILQFLSVTIFQKIPILQALSNDDYNYDADTNTNQLNLFNIPTGH
jgi:hypothetical protein